MKEKLIYNNMFIRYSDFIGEQFLSMINETVIYFTPEFKRILGGMSKSDPDVSKILDFFNNTEGYDVKPDVTYLNAEKDGYVSYTTKRNAEKIISAAYPSYLDVLGDNPNVVRAEIMWTHSISKVKSKNVVRLGRLINQLFPGKFSDKQIEKFVNEYKSLVETYEEKIKVVEGDDIKFWYNLKNYAIKSGSLGNSCMSSVPPSFFEIYAQNPEVCKMVIITELNKLKARALVWKVTNQDFGYFMDRQYSIADSDINKLRKYAEDQGWAYKTNNNHHSIETVTYNGKESNIEMQIKLKQWNGSYDYNEYPYMDTFKIYDPVDGTLLNRNKNEGEIGDYFLCNTDGTPDEILDEKYSDYYDENIPSVDAVWSVPLRDWLWSNDTVVVSIGRPELRGLYPNGHSQLAYLSNRGEFANTNDCSYSNMLSSWFLNEDCVSVIDKITSSLSISIDFIPNEGHTDDKYVDISELKGLDWFEKLSTKDKRLQNCAGVLKTELEKDENGEWIPINSKIITYKVLEHKELEHKEFEYLSKIDSDILECKINMDDSRSESTIDYNQRLLPIYPDLSKNASRIMSDMSNRYNITRDRLERDVLRRDYASIGERKSEIESRIFIYK